MTSSQHGLYVQGYTHATMAGTMGREAARRSQSSKAGLSSDCRLQPACMKSELLVTAGQLYCGEYVPGPCTHRPSRHGSWQHLKSVT
jgi:EAL domain-containing protein (putative c-di-GMP-specific phosphodiesterase class I)